MNHEPIIQLVKEAKRLLIIAQRYEDAAIVRELEAIMDIDGSKISDRSLTAICTILDRIINKK